MTHAWDAFTAWLRGMIDPSTPFTVEDSATLYTMIRAQLGAKPQIEVYTTIGDKVFVRVDDREWVIDVVE